MKQNRHLALAEAICVISVQKAFLNELQLREPVENGSTQLEWLEMVETGDLGRRYGERASSQAVFTAPAWTPITIYKTGGLRANIRKWENIFLKKPT